MNKTQIIFIDLPQAAAAHLDFCGKSLIVLIGKNVARAFGANNIAYFEPFLLGYINAIGFTNVQFQNDWQAPGRPSHTILQSSGLGRGEGGPGYIEIKYISAVVVPHPSSSNQA